MKTVLAGLVVASMASALWGEPRLPWTTSRLEGTPEPAAGFGSEPVLPQLRLADALELAPVPGSDRLLVVERRGKISTFPPRRKVEAVDEVIDLLPLHPKLDYAYGVALHPRFRETRQIFISYAMPDGQADGTKLSRFTLTSLDPLRADPASEEIILTWRAGGHNGANLQFGPDGYLYVSTGDAGPAAPPDILNTGQDTSDLLSSILRIDIDQRDPGRNYRVPPDNPWFNNGGTASAGAGAAAAKTATVRPELWAYGLRNPWKMSFDRATGNLWCGDIGWEVWEMVHLIRRGGNYGWSAFEASQPIKPALANLLAPISPPIVAHPHSEAASITGGFVYHGSEFPELANAYLYGDWVTGKIWALWYDGKQITRHEEIADTPHAIVAFSADDAGEPYYLHYGPRSTLHRLVRNPQAAPGSPFPRRLSETGLYQDVARQQPAPGVYPFGITSPMWENGASTARLIGLRDTSAVTTTVKVQRNSKSNDAKADYATKWPTGAVLARTITVGPLAVAPQPASHPIETQVLQYDGEKWNAYTYRWNATGTDADLVPPDGAEMTLRVAADPQAEGPPSREMTWRFQSRAECLRCHNTWNSGPLAFTPSQLRGASNAQTRALIERGIVDGNFFEQTRLGGETSVGQNPSARAVLHANCAPCHAANSGGAVSLFLNQDLLTGQMNMVDVVPSQGGLGLVEPKIVDPGDPWNSVLALRMAKTGTGHMPLIGAREVDVAGLKVIEDWIALMPSDHAAPKPWDETTWDPASIEGALRTVAGAMRLRRAIDDGKLEPGLRRQAFKLAWSSTNPTVRDIFERFKPDELRERTLSATIDADALLRLSGDIARGAQLLGVQGKLPSCQACHVIQGQGRHFGPDLSRIGAQQGARQILESILAPSKVVAPLYRTTVVELRDGTSQAGFVRARGAKELVLTIATGQTVKIKLADVKTETTLLTSLMPEGQLQGLTPQEAADVVAYLASLK